MAPTIAEGFGFGGRPSSASAASLSAFLKRSGQVPSPSEIPTNIGILVTAGVLFTLLIGLCFLDHRKRARMTDAGKQYMQVA